MTFLEKLRENPEYANVDPAKSDIGCPDAYFEEAVAMCGKCTGAEDCVACWNTEFPVVEEVEEVVVEQEEEEMSEPTFMLADVDDPINHPHHYTDGGMECIDEMILIFGEEAVMNFCLCNAWKYRRRAMYKGWDEDMKKSHWYIAKYKELLEGNGDVK